MAELALLKLSLVERKDVAERSVLVETPAAVASSLLSEDLKVDVPVLVEAATLAMLFATLALLVLGECLRVVPCSVLTNLAEVGSGEGEPVLSEETNCNETSARKYTHVQKKKRKKRTTNNIFLFFFSIDSFCFFFHL